MVITTISLICAIIGLTLTFLSAYYFSPPLFRSKEDFEKMSGTFFDGNPFLEEALVQDQKNAKIGFAFLSFGFFFQMLSIFLQIF